MEHAVSPYLPPLPPLPCTVKECGFLPCPFMLSPSSPRTVKECGFLPPRPVRGQLWNMLSSSEPDGPDPDSEDAGADTAAAADAAAAAAAAHSHRRGDKGAGFSHILGEGGGAGPSSSPSTNIRALVSLVHDPKHTPQVSAERAARARRPGACIGMPVPSQVSFTHSSERRINWGPFCLSCKFLLQSRLGAVLAIAVCVVSVMAITTRKH